MPARMQEARGVITPLLLFYSSTLLFETGPHVRQRRTTRAGIAAANPAAERCDPCDCETADGQWHAVSLSLFLPSCQHTASLRQCSGDDAYSTRRFQTSKNPVSVVHPLRCGADARVDDPLSCFLQARIEWLALCDLCATVLPWMHFDALPQTSRVAREMLDIPAMHFYPATQFCILLFAVIWM